MIIFIKVEIFFQLFSILNYFDFLIRFFDCELVNYENIVNVLINFLRLLVCACVYLCCWRPIKHLPICYCQKQSFIYYLPTIFVY